MPYSPPAIPDRPIARKRIPRPILAALTASIPEDLGQVVLDATSSSIPHKAAELVSAHTGRLEAVLARAAEAAGQLDDLKESARQQRDLEGANRQVGQPQEIPPGNRPLRGLRWSHSHADVWKTGKERCRTSGSTWTCKGWSKSKEGLLFFMSRKAYRLQER